MCVSHTCDGRNKASGELALLRSDTTDKDLNGFSVADLPHASLAALGRSGAASNCVVFSATWLKAAADICFFILKTNSDGLPRLLNNEVSHQQEPSVLLVRQWPGCGPAALPLHRPAWLLGQRCF